MKLFIFVYGYEHLLICVYDVHYCSEGGETISEQIETPSSSKVSLDCVIFIPL